MSLAEKLNRFVTRYTANLDWHEAEVGVGWITQTGNLRARIIRRNGCWWLYVRRPDGTQARAVKLHANITKAKRMAEAALAESWLLDWPVDE